MDDLTSLRMYADGFFFMIRIRDPAVCALASSLNNGRPCRVLGKMLHGSYNSCRTVVFSDADGGGQAAAADCPRPGEEKWIIRFPTLPRLAYPVEKLRAEIATMKYLAERTTIPVPRVLAYGFGGDYPTGVPFVAMEYIEGDSLLDRLSGLDDEGRTYLYAQLADMFVQLREQEFPPIGALTLDDEGAWRFARNRPLSIDFSNAQVDGQCPADFMPPDQTFESTSEYCGSLMTLEVLNYLRQRDRAGDEENARNQLVAIHQFRDALSGWIRPEYNGGPFVLTHGDFLPGNIMVEHDSLRIVAVIDWEYSHTAPLQLLVPPTWLTALPMESLLSRKGAVEYAEELRRLTDAVRAAEQKLLSPVAGPRLSEVWERSVQPTRSFGIAHALLRRCNIPMVCWTHMQPPGEPHEPLVARFFDPAHNGAAGRLERLVLRKVEDKARIRAVLANDAAVDEVLDRPASPLPPLSTEDVETLKAFVEGFTGGEAFVKGFTGRFMRGRGWHWLVRGWAWIASLVRTKQLGPRLVRDAAMGAIALVGLSCLILARCWRVRDLELRRRVSRDYPSCAKGRAGRRHPRRQGRTLALYVISARDMS
ncbi:MAG: hypothetical protein M1832_005597 [Thelocarpon impressellum]|nr:MAG: hypothetical protein M1832_005597 [Thelocarpon impressellum]